MSDESRAAGDGLDRLHIFVRQELTAARDLRFTKPGIARLLSLWSYTAKRAPVGEAAMTASEHGEGLLRAACRVRDWLEEQDDETYARSCPAMDVHILVNAVLTRTPAPVLGDDVERVVAILDRMIAAAYPDAEADDLRTVRSAIEALARVGVPK